MTGALFCRQVLAHVSDVTELRPSGAASTRFCVRGALAPALLSPLVFVPAAAPCGVDSVFCPGAVPPLDSPTALCGEKSALFSNYCTLA